MIFSVDNKTLMIDSHFRNGVTTEGQRHDDTVLQKFQQKFPEFNFIVADFTTLLETLDEYFEKQVVSTAKKMLDDQHCLPMNS